MRTPDGAPTIRKRGCMTCSAGTRKDCGSCDNYKDKTKYGGKGRKK